MTARQPDLFTGSKAPRKMPRPDRAYSWPAKAAPKPLVYTSMAAWVRHMHRLFAIERLIQRHPDLAVVEQLRAERARRMT